MANVDIFKGATIDEEVHEQSIQDITDDNKDNLISKGLVSLEKLDMTCKTTSRNPRTLKPIVPH